MNRALLILCGLLVGSMWASPSMARPADEVVLLVLGEDRILPTMSGDWQVHVFPAGLAEVRVLRQATEILVKGLAEGEGLLIFSNPRLKSSILWSLRVGKERPRLRKPDRQPVRRACLCETDKKLWLNCQVKSQACLEALHSHLSVADLKARDIQLRFDLEILRQQLQRLQKILKDEGLGGVELGFSGGTLVLDGVLRDEDAYHRLLALLNRYLVGRMNISDRIKRLDASKK